MPSPSSSSASGTNRHEVFGLIVDSCLPLPELRPAGGTGPADIVIAYGAVPAELPGTLARGVCYQAAPGKLILHVRGIARYLIADGRQITIEREPEAEDDDIRLFLLGSAVGALLHQRQDLVLHGSAIAVRGWSAAFIGLSGVGKSTLAMAFRRKGYTVMTDDLCVVRTAQPGGPLLAHPGPPQSKLWLDSLKELDISPDSLNRIRRKLEKRALPLSTEETVPVPLPLRRIYLLRPNNEEGLKLNPLKGPAKFNTLKNHTYRFGFVGGLGGKPAHFQQALALAQQAEVTCVTRLREPFQLDAMVALIEADFPA